MSPGHPNWLREGRKHRQALRRSPFTETFFSFPPAKKPSHWPSGEKKGLTAPSVRGWTWSPGYPSHANRAAGCRLGWRRRREGFHLGKVPARAGPIPQVADRRQRNHSARYVLGGRGFRFQIVRPVMAARSKDTTPHSNAPRQSARMPSLRQPVPMLSASHLPQSHCTHRLDRRHSASVVPALLSGSGGWHDPALAGHRLGRADRRGFFFEDGRCHAQLALPGNACWPVSISYSTAPSEKISLRRPALSPPLAPVTCTETCRQ